LKWCGKLCWALPLIHFTFVKELFVGWDPIARYSLEHVSKVWANTICWHFKEKAPGSSRLSHSPGAKYYALYMSDNVVSRMEIVMVMSTPPVQYNQTPLLSIYAHVWTRYTTLVPRHSSPLLPFSPRIKCDVMQTSQTLFPMKRS